ncbi:hypothetical protein [Variovorax sp. 38R]|uniref:hypothetical protein n=1 Tax=Variovorax sp. 38R TaxID=2774875 RepID=UPI0017816B66|nr:hypothetical protein [Variovorax sp. 38R]QOF77619.1 hypothetical protein IG196_25245 [Variovorax sp. 38R]
MAVVLTFMRNLGCVANAGVPDAFESGLVLVAKELGEFGDVLANPLHRDSTLLAIWDPQRE